MKIKNCQVCDASFSTNNLKQIYCSYSCANTGGSVVFMNKPTCKWCQQKFYRPSPSKNHTFCSKKCEFDFKRKDRVMVKCKLCEDTLYIPQSQKNRRKFCSPACMWKYRKLHPIKTRRSFRSYGECALACLLKKNYKELEIVTSDRQQLNGYELDIWIPKLKIGIEYNGPHHYKPVYGNDIFEKTIIADKNKQKIAAEKGIKIVYIIPNDNVRRGNISKVQTIFIKCCEDIGLESPTLLDFSAADILDEQKNNKPANHRYINLGKTASPQTRQKMSLARRKIYVLRSPDGTIVSINNMKLFCKQNNMQYTHVIARFKKNKPCKGWEIFVE